MVALARLQLPTCPRLPLPPQARPLPIDSIRDITGSEKLSKKSAAFK